MVAKIVLICVLLLFVIGCTAQVEDRSQSVPVDSVADTQVTDSAPKDTGSVASEPVIAQPEPEPTQPETDSTAETASTQPTPVETIPEAKKLDYVPSTGPIPVAVAEPTPVAECKSKVDDTIGIEIWCFDAVLPDDKRCWFDQEGCQALRAGELQDATICEGLSDPINKAICYASVAERTLDTNLCSKISQVGTGEDFEIAHSECLGQIAAAKQDKSGCDIAPDKDMCIYMYAELTKDVASCSLISQPDLKEGCEFMAK